MPGKRKKNKKLSPEQAFEQLTELCKGKSLSLPALRKTLEAFPEETIRAHGEGDTLLHYVCYNERVTLEIVEYLVDLHPGALEHVADYGWLPLHRACLNNLCPSEVVEFLVSKYPEGLRIPWPPRGLPLHCLVDRRDYRYGDDHRVIEEGIGLDLRLVWVLAEAYPEALTNQDNDGSNIPLLLACQRNDVSLELVQMLVGEDFASINVVGDYNQGLPLHKIFESGRCPPVDVVKFLLEHGSEESLNVRNSHGETSFHTACRNDAPIEIIQLFVKKRHELLEQEGDNAGNLPLHSLCLNGNLGEHITIMKYLVEEYPEAVRTRNRYGMLPLDYASSRSLEATKFLLDQYPESVQNRDFDGRLPFHFACRDGSLELVRYLSDLYPESVVETTFLGDLPLHKATECDGGVAPNIRFLMEKYPDGVKEPGHEGDLPLHRLCKSFYPEFSLIKGLFNAFPGAIHAKNAKGCLPLHCACSGYTAPNREIIDFLVTQLPYGIREPDNEGRTPIHYACSRDFSLEELKHLIELYPDAVRVNSATHGLPIHLACSNDTSLDVVKYLESLYPESVDIYNDCVGLPIECAKSRYVFEYLLMQRYDSFFRRRGPFPLHALFQDDELKDKKVAAERFIDYFSNHARDIDRQGSFPLHQAVTTVTDVDFIDKLIKLNPEAVEKRDSQGSLPLHYALRHQPSRVLVERLLNLFPDSAQIVDHQGCTPMHIACRYGASLEVVSQLTTAYPEGIHALDNHACIPLHVACRRGSLLAVVQHLVDSDEMTLRLTDENQEFPLHKACRGGHIALVRYLVERNMPSASERNASGVLPVFILCQASGKSQEIQDSPEYVETIWQLLLAHPESVMSALV